MIRGIFILLQIVLCFVLQSSVFSYFELAGIVPDIALILVIAVAYQRGQIPAMATGLLTGLLFDVCFGSIIGVCALLYLMLGFLAGFSHKIYDKRDFATPLLMAAAGEFLYSFFYYVFEFLLRNRLSLGYYMVHLILPRVIYTVFAAAFFYPLFLGIHGLLLRIEKKE